MDREQIQSFIKECRPYMLEQLQKEVVYYLKENDALSEAEFNDIILSKSRENQIVLLLDVLPSKQAHHLNCFIQYISDWYPWVIHHFRRKSQIVESADEEKEKMLDLGEVPPIPSRHVPRKDQYAELCKYLYELKRNEYIVVHGMRGSGKSTLVADVLRHSYTLALDTFKQKVFWLTVGRESCIDELTIQQELCSKLMFNRGYGLQIPLDSKSAKQFLKEKLTNADLEDCLLILDDVSSSSIIQALDVGCRILVTTDDTAIMNRTKKKVYKVKVSEGFTEDETLSLFKQCIHSENLPKEAKLIYSICKGFPLTISLISSQLEEHKEDAQNSTSRWNFYINKLRENNIRGAIGLYDYDKQEQVIALYKAIGMSIDSLRPDLKDFYQDFALFMDDVNIKVEVLSTLWELEEKAVHDIMQEFERKCLVLKAWNHIRKCYIYCVHDLLLNYLKEQISLPEKEALHRKLIAKYQKLFGDDVTNFPISDNYIFLYLGHHLKEANLLQEFPRVFLDLSFIDKKITNFGAADLLLDFRKYQKFIAQDAESTKRYEDVLHFIKHVGACLTPSNSDIVQFGLCEHKHSYVYERATAMAQGGKYFEILTDIPKEKSAPTVHYGREEIVTAAFASDENIIVASTHGTIKLINIPQNRTLISFREHEKKVTLLQLAKNLIYFLSGSDDCTIRIWYLNDYSSLEKNISEKARTPSPQLRQTDWLDMFPNQRMSGERAVAVLDSHKLPIKDARFSNMGTLIVSTSDDNQTILWRLAMERKNSNLALSVIGHELIETKKRFESVAFSNDDTVILCAMREGQVVLYRSNDGAQVSVVDVGHEIESMCVVPGISHIAFLGLHKDRFKVWDILPEMAGNDEGRKSQLRYQTAGRKREDYFVCSAVSCDGAYVAIATKNQNIAIYELSSGHKITKFCENSGIIRSLSWSRQNTALLTTYGSELLKIWHFSKNGVLNDAGKLSPSIFDAQWIWDCEDDDSSDRFFVTAALGNDKKIHVFYDLREKKTLSSLSKADISQCCISPFDGNIIYACEDGSVHLVILDSWNEGEIMRVPCLKLLKLKVFTLSDKILLVLVLAETAPGKASLIGCTKRGDDFSFDMLTYECDSEVIFDFSADLRTNSVYIVDNNHILKVYNCRTAQEKFREGPEQTECMDKMKFCDISTDFKYIVTGTKRMGLLRLIEQGATKRMMIFENHEVNVFKFNHDGSKLAVGFAEGSFNIYETEKSLRLYSVGPLKFASEVIDFVWCADSNRLLAMYNREIILYNIREQLKPESVLFISVDKVVCNHAFTKCVTIDSEGLFQVLKFPRN